VEQRQEIVGQGPAFGSRIFTIAALAILACAVLWAAAALFERRLSVAPQPFPSDSFARNPGRPASVLSPGESVRIGTDERGVQHLESDDIANRLAWTRGEVRFNGETLGAAVDEFNRYNRLKLKIADTAIAGLRVNGTFNAREPRAFVAALERSRAVRSRTIQSAGSDGEVIELELVAANE
jgi:hypothetical protein